MTVQECTILERERFNQIKLLVQDDRFHIDRSLVYWEDEEFNALTSSAMNGSIDIVKYLLLFGADANYSDENGVTALYMASKNGFSDCVKLLLDRVDDEDFESLNQALMYAVKGAASFSKFPNKFQSCDKVVRMLVSRGADPNYSDPRQSGKTPLMQLVEWYYADCSRSSGWPLLLLEMLLRNGANMNQCDKNGVSAYSLAKKLQLQSHAAIEETYPRRLSSRGISSDNPSMKVLQNPLIDALDAFARPIPQKDTPQGGSIGKGTRKGIHSSSKSTFAYSNLLPSMSFLSDMKLF